MEKIRKPCPDFIGEWGELGTCRNAALYSAAHPGISHEYELICPPCTQSEYEELARPLEDLVPAGTLLLVEGNERKDEVIDKSLCPHVTPNYLFNRGIPKKKDEMVDCESDKIDE